MNPTRSRRLGRIVGLALASVLVLAACEITVTSSGAHSVQSLDRNSDYRTAIEPVRVELDPGASWSRTYDFGAERGRPVWVVVSSGDLFLLDASRNVEATSSVSTYFAAGRDGLIDASLADAALRAQEVPPSRAAHPTSCIGACIIVRHDDDSAIRFTDKVVRVRNPFDEPLSVRVHVFSRALDDLDEPANDRRSGAYLIDTVGSTFGALETLNDADWFELDFRSNVTVHAPRVPDGDPFPEDYLTLWVEWVDDRGDPIEAFRVRPNQTRTISSVSAGDFLRITSIDGRAGPADATLYELSVEGIVGTDVDIAAAD